MSPSITIWLGDKYQGRLGCPPATADDRELVFRKATRQQARRLEAQTWFASFVVRATMTRVVAWIPAIAEKQLVAQADASVAHSRVPQSTHQEHQAMTAVRA